ncbi:hypothetical protein D2187_29800, partial [Escherichia coli]
KKYAENVRVVVRLRQQWQDVQEECRQAEVGSGERLRNALLNVDYTTSFELPFRLLLTRTSQLIAVLWEEWDISQKNVVFNDKRF